MEANPQNHRIFEIATEYYYSLMKNSTDAISYLKTQRKHDPNIVKSFKIGWTGTDRKGLYNHLKAHPEIRSLGEPGDLDDILVNTGLVAAKDGQCYDYFPSEVLVFPLMKGGKVNHFRFKDPTKKVNYQFPAEYNLNGQLFYNEDDLRKEKIIIVEGENDILTTLRHINLDDLKVGVVATLGPLSEEKMNVLTKLKNKEFFLFFDSDGEFNKSEIKRKNNPSKGIGYCKKFIESSAGILDCSVIVYGDGSQKDDPDSWLRDREKGTLIALIDDAQDGLTWYIEQLEKTKDKVKSLKLIKPVIDMLVKTPKNRELYIDLLVQKYQLKRSMLLNLLKESGVEIEDSTRQSYDMYDPEGNVEVSDCSYWMAAKNGAKVMVSNFVMTISAIFNYEDSQSGESWLKYEAFLINYEGKKTRPIIFEPAERSNPFKFDEVVNGQGDYHFFGNAQQLAYIWSLAERQWQEKRIIYLVRRFGYLPNHDLWLFDNCVVKNNVVYPKKDDIIRVGDFGYKAEDVIIYSNDRPKINFDIKLTADDIENIIENMWMLHDGNVNEFKGLFALGWMAASVYRNEILEKNGSFPILFYYGPSETGKSTSAQFLFKFFGFRNPAEGWGPATEASMGQMFAQISLLPAYFEEYRNYNDNRQEKKLGVLRNAWAGVGQGKGGSKGIRQMFDSLALVLLDGEQIIKDKGTSSRAVYLRFKKLNALRRQAYKWLSENIEKLSAFYLMQILKKTPANTAKILADTDCFNKLLEEMGVTEDRTRRNYSAILAGFKLLNYSNSSDEFMVKFLEFVKTEALEDVVRKQQEDVMQKFFEHVSRVMLRAPFDNSVKLIQDGEVLVMAFSEFYHELKKELRQAQDDLESFNRSTILDYIVKSDFLITHPDGRKDKTTHFNGQKKRAMYLNINMMPESIRELFDLSESEKKEDVF